MPSDLRREIIGTATLALSAFGFAMPSLSELRKSSPYDADTVRDMRLGQTVAVTFIALIVGIDAWYRQDYTSMVIAGLIVMMFMALYGWVLGDYA